MFGEAMLHYAIMFLLIALVAALFRFGTLADTTTTLAKIFFVLFLIGAIYSFFFRKR